MKIRSISVMAVVATGFTTLSSPAAAYVRTTTESGAPTAWKAPCVTMEFSLGAPPPELTADQYLDAAQQAGAAWSNSALDGATRCTNVIFTVKAVPAVAGVVGMDYHNRLIFRQGGWCRDPPPTDSNEPRCYEDGALAITTVFQVKPTGEILDADLEVNATTYTWGDYVAHPEQFVPLSTHDFQGAITHEFGHVIGLDHTCFSPGGAYADGTPVPRPTDNNGNPVPDCDPATNPPAIKDATMYVSVGSTAAEVGLRSLSPDDLQAACEIYPFTTNFVCVAPTGSDGSKSRGCSYSAQPGLGAIASVLALLALAAVVRRRG